MKKTLLEKFNRRLIIGMQIHSKEKYPFPTGGESIINPNDIGIVLLLHFQLLFLLQEMLCWRSH